MIATLDAPLSRKLSRWKPAAPNTAFWIGPWLAKREFVLSKRSARRQCDGHATYPPPHIGRAFGRICCGKSAKRQKIRREELRGGRSKEVFD